MTFSILVRCTEPKGNDERPSAVSDICKLAVTGGIDTFLPITLFVIGLLGYLSVISLPSAASYTLMGAGAFCFVTLFILNLFTIYKTKKEVAEENATIRQDRVLRKSNSSLHNLFREHQRKAGGLYFTNKMSV